MCGFVSCEFVEMKGKAPHKVHNLTPSPDLLSPCLHRPTWGGQAPELGEAVRRSRACRSCGELEQQEYSC